jgi:hypothetical protein
MRKLITALAAILLVSPALAQNASSQSPQNSQSQQQGAAASQPQKPTAQIAQQIRSNLEKAGFKNIKLMPSSFLVRATDQNNNPVMMVINPDTITEVSESQASGGKTTGQNTGGQQNMQSSGQTNNKY